MRSILTLLLAVLAVPSAFGQEKPAAITVVKTWKDLQERPAIDLGDGVKVRLGLEADKLPQWSGGLLYCLTEGFTPPNKGSGDLPFGPARATIAFGDGATEIDKVKWWSGRENLPKGQYLFVRAIPIDRVGKFSVRVADSGGKLLAEATVEGTREPFHPWMPWLEGFNHPVAPREGIALPTVPDISPLMFIEPGKAKKGNLPTLLPTDEKPALAIKMDGDEIVIRAESEFTTSRPDYHFLARWWVNGKPFVPKQAEKFWVFDGYGRVSTDKEMRLSFEFRPDRLGAKPGDKIGLQLLHAEGQWSWCADPSLHKLASSSRKDGENVRVSNQIEFVAPEAKKKKAE